MRIAFDLDGVLADLHTPFVQTAMKLFPDLDLSAVGADDEVTPAALDDPAGSPSDDERDGGSDDAPPRLPNVVLTRRQHAAVWEALSRREDFWEGLGELEPGIIARLAGMAEARRWDILFITSRPRSTGRTVQRQTQRWLERHGFALPSVYVVHGSRGRLADALGLDAVIDDRASNCLDVVLESRAGAVLVWRGNRGPVPTRAQRLGIAVAASVADCLDTIAKADGQDPQGFVDRLKRLFGLKTTPRGVGRAQE
jgi:hypothetical protein